MEDLQFHAGRHHFGGVDFKYRLGSHCEFHDPWTNHPHLHESYYEICLVISGIGLYQHGNLEMPLKRGDVFIADPGVVHEISSPETRDLSLIFGIFTIDVRGLGKGVEGNLMRSFLSSHRIHQRQQDDLLPYVDLLSRRRMKGSSSWDSSLALSLMLELIGHLVEGDIGGVSNTPLQDQARIKIEEWGERDFNLEELAQSCDVSLRTLRREVRKKMGQSLGDWVHGLRLERATRMLQMNFRVGETARACGYDDPDRFTRLFKKRYGVTPKRYQLQEFKAETTFMEDVPKVN